MAPRLILLVLYNKPLSQYRNLLLYAELRTKRPFSLGQCQAAPRAKGRVGEVADSGFGFRPLDAGGDAAARRPYPGEVSRTRNSRSSLSENGSGAATN
jgi:hypothetical protein